MRIRPLPAKADAHQLLHEIAALPATCAPRTADKPVMLYGAGKLGRMAKQLLDHIGIPIRAVVDANAKHHRNDPFWNSTQLLAPTEVAASERAEVLLAVTIANQPFSTIAQLLTDQGWPDVAMFYDVAEAYRCRHPLGNGWFAGNMNALDVTRTGEVLDGWADAVSIAHHLQFIAWHRLRQDWIFHNAPVNADERFLIPEVRKVLTEHEAFADFGAHRGSTSQALLDAVGGRVKRIWAVEPDPENHRALLAMIATKPPSLRRKITALPIGVGSEPGILKFVPGLGYASQCSDQGHIEITIAPIDVLDISPSFIKLHIEGMEMAALAGARKTILRCRPIIALTVYHNRMGIWEIPCWLMRELTDYSFYLRNHSWCGTGCVVYCIPAERTGARTVRKHGKRSINSSSPQPSQSERNIML